MNKKTELDYARQAWTEAVKMGNADLIAIAYKDLRECEKKASKSSKPS